MASQEEVLRIIPELVRKLNDEVHSGSVRRRHLPTPLLCTILTNETKPMRSLTIDSEGVWRYRCSGPVGAAEIDGDSLGTLLDWTALVAKEVDDGDITEYVGTHWDELVDILHAALSDTLAKLS